MIKTGLRKISVSYSRISLEDVRKKLILDTIDEAECIVAKADPKSILIPCGSSLLQHVQCTCNTARALTGVVSSALPGYS